MPGPRPRTRTPPDLAQPVTRLDARHRAGHDALSRPPRPRWAADCVKGRTVVVGPEITSVRSARVQAARRLAKRAFRVREGRFLAEGPQAVREAVDRPDTVRGAVRHRGGGRPSRRPGDRALGRRCRRPPGQRRGDGRPVADRQPAGRWSRSAASLHRPLAEVLAGSPQLVTVLAHARDPGNAGTVLRTADAAGAQAVASDRRQRGPVQRQVRAGLGGQHLPPPGVGRA